MKSRANDRKTSVPGKRAATGPQGLAFTPPAQEHAPNHTGLPQRLRAAGTLAPGASAGVAHGPHEAARLPDNLKAGVEGLSGLALDDVRVHYNSSKPAALQALAYAQGTDIHVGPGQERHLPHEAWHVVQQKQGRVQATMQTKERAPINAEEGLEQEADRLGAKAMRGMKAEIGQFRLSANAPTAKRQALSHQPIQRKKKHAKKFIGDNDLGIEAEIEAVTRYVNDKSNPTHLRRGLLQAWNRAQISLNSIATPSDLEASSTAVTMLEDLSGWDSGEEDTWDLEKVKETREKGKMDLERSGQTADQTGVSEMDFMEAIRLGRQVVKRDAYDQIPITTTLGRHYFEYASPGTKDIYATPLEEVAQEPKKKGKGKARKKYKRAGTSSDFNWKNLARNLGRRKYKSPHDQMGMILRFFLKKGKTDLMDSETAEAIAAIGSDLMKGSSGGRFFLRRALAKIKSSKTELGFDDVFTGKSPIYEPAAKGGRALVSSTHAQFQLDANTLLGVNNCLINAIALASPLGRMANLGELIRIREQLQNYGEMLVASPAIIQLIRPVLGIQNPIRVVYPGIIPDENFPGIGPLLTIYHVDGNHFTHIPPILKSGKKKAKT